MDKRDPDIEILKPTSIWIEEKGAPENAYETEINGVKVWIAPKEDDDE
jgi:hypothetical protein